MRESRALWFDDGNSGSIVCLNHWTSVCASYDRGRRASRVFRRRGKGVHSGTSGRVDWYGSNYGVAVGQRAVPGKYILTDQVLGSRSFDCSVGDLSLSLCLLMTFGVTLGHSISDHSTCRCAQDGSNDSPGADLVFRFRFLCSRPRDNDCWLNYLIYDDLSWDPFSRGGLDF